MPRTEAVRAHTARSPSQRCWAALRAVALLAVMALGASDAAAQFVVNSTANDDGTGGTTGTLSWAIHQANAAGGSSTISFDPSLAGHTLTLIGNLPPITCNVTINGFAVGGLTISGNNAYSAFMVDSGTVTIKNLTIADTNAAGGAGGNTGHQGGGGGGGLGAGGALLVNSSATVTVENVSFSGNAATGGAGGNTLVSSANASGGGGGGGLHGAGGNSNFFAGGGGGGFQGTGGTNSTGGIISYAGGGGGGLYGNGGASGRYGGGGGGGALPLVSNGGLGGLYNGGSGGGLAGGAGGTYASPTPVAGGVGGGGGGGGYTQSGASGGTFGGGGGEGYNASNASAGHGGDFGGGGGADRLNGVAGNGGFGGGGGGGGTFNSSAASGGFGGGAGGGGGTGGNGGDAYGGAVFVRTGGSLTVIDSGVSGSSATAGAGGAGFLANGTAGAADGAGMYLMSGTTATIEVDSGSETISDPIGGSGGLSKTGNGTLILSGTNDYTGTTEVAAGTLDLTGSLTSNTTIESGATLSGGGTITGNLTNSGTLGLGGAIATLSVDGTFTQNTGGNLQIAVDHFGTGSLLSVNGTANLAGTVEVQPLAASYTSGTRYVFLEATTLSGAFSGITLDTLSSMHAVLGYDIADGYAYFTLLSNQSDFAAYAATSNQLAVANYIDANSTDPALQSLVNALNSLPPSGVQNALDQMSGAIYGSVAQTDFQSTTIELSFITRRIANGLSGINGAPGGLATNSYGNKISASALAANDSNLIVRGQNVYAPFMPQGRWTTWGFGYGLGGNAQGTSNAAGLNYSLGGTVAGLEMRDDNHLIGGYAGYVGSHVGSYLAGQSVNVNGGQTGVYLRGDDGRNYYIALAGMGADGYNSHRLMQFSGINTTAFANYGGWQSQVYLERGVTLQNSVASIQPYAALQYLYVRQNSFTETGAGAMNLKVAGIDGNSLRSLIGIRLAGNAGLSLGGGAITPVARAHWLHEFLSTTTGLNAEFAPIGGTSFAVTGTSLGRDWAILGTGLNWNVGRGWQAYANYDAQVNVVQTFHVGSGGFQYSW